MRILCIGGSNTYGYDPRSYIGSRYPQNVRWTGRLSDHEVINCGINGMTVPRDTSVYVDLIEKKDPDMIIVMLGTNDLLEGAGAEETRIKMERFLGSVLEIGKPILLVSPPHLNYGEWIQSKKLQEESRKLGKLYRELADRKGCLFADAGEWDIEMAFDGVHFSSEGHEEFARKLEEIIKQSTLTSSRTRLIAILPIIAGAFWGIVGVFVRILDADGLDNLTICFSRAAVGALVLISFVLLTDRKKFHVDIKDLPIILGMSLSGAVLLMFSYNYALTELTISLAVVLLCTAPVFVLLISALIFRERISTKKMICMVLAFAGCAMLSGLFEGDAPLRWSVFGVLMGLAAAFFNGVYMILSKGIAQKQYSPITISLYSFIFAALMLIPFVSWDALTGYISAKPLESTTVLLLQSVCSSLIPTLAYITAVKNMDAGKAAILESGSEPTAALIVGIVLYSEIPSIIGFAGMVITVGALIVLASDRE